jgi:hypothetical protein
MAQSKSTSSAAEKKPTTKKTSSRSTASTARRQREVDSTEEMERSEEETSAKSNSSQQKGRFKQKRTYILLISAALLLGLGYLLYKALVFAWVGNVPLTRLDQFNRMDRQSGKETKDQMINEQLVLNEARKRRVVATEEDINKQLAQIETQQGGAEKLDEALKDQQMTREDLKKQLRFSVLINKMFEAEGKVEEKELNDYIEQNKDQLGLTDPNNASQSAKAKEAAAESLKRQKTNQAFTTWLQQAQASSEVKRL